MLFGGRSPSSTGPQARADGEAGMADVFDTGKVAAVADERTTLNVFLDFYRNAMKAKLNGLTEEQANRRLVPSDTTLASLIKHLARVEVSWFQHRLAQTPLEELPNLKRVFDEPDSDFRVEEGETIEISTACVTPSAPANSVTR